MVDCKAPGESLLTSREAPGGSNLRHRGVSMLRHWERRFYGLGRVDFKAPGGVDVKAPGVSGGSTVMQARERPWRIDFENREGRL